MSSEPSTESDIEDVDMMMDFLMLNQMHNQLTNSLPKQPCRTSVLIGVEYVHELLSGHPTRIYDMLRMDAHTFMSLCNTLRNGFLDEGPPRHVRIEESLTIFLLTVGHSTRQKVVAERFQHSNETINRHIKWVMGALAKLGVLIIRLKDPHETAPEIVGNPKFNPYFLNCLGAIDGTHISAWAPASKQTAFRGRKSTVTQNVLAACSFDVLFTFVYTGWEGSVHDSCVFLNAITSLEVKFPMPPAGKYYVVDAGFTNVGGFLSPYRGERYHMQEFRGRTRAFSRHRELFNYRHSSLRNVIERYFGVLKARFSLLKSMPNYKLVRQGALVVTCCTIHNFIRLNASADGLFVEFQANDIELEMTNHPPYPDVDMSQEQMNAMTRLRDEIAMQM